jgi:hypothetical protein
MADGTSFHVVADGSESALVQAPGVTHLRYALTT